MIRTSSSGRVSEMTTGTTHPDKHQSKTTMWVCKSKLNTKFSNNTAGTQSKYLSVGHLHPPRWLQPSWDWDTCTRHCDPREQCLESGHALWYHVTHAQNGTAQANDITDTTLWLRYLYKTLRSSRTMPWEWTCSVIPCHTRTEWHSSSQRHHWYNTVIEILVEDTAILENNALRVDMLCDTMSHTHTMAQLKPTTSLIQHCDWDTCRGHYDPREWCLESEHALWYHVTHTHRMAQLKPPTSLIQHCDWDTCRGHCDPREWCLESEHALWYHVTHAQNGTAQANDITDTTLWLRYL